ncbi:MAG: DUF6164 family protein [Nitrosomonas sp.]|nr:MAG: DUF6164 family protein [Nitrosomonas sp.]
MAKILFRLSGVSDEEAGDVRELLIRHEIEFYETSAGNWGVSMAAIWLQDGTQFERARALIDAYQVERVVKMRQAHAQLKREGKHKTFLQAVSRNPISFTVHLALAMLVIYLSVQLVLDLAK